MEITVKEESKQFNEKNGILDKRYVNRFISMCGRAKSLEDKIKIINILSKTKSIDIINEFADLRGVKILCQFLK